MRKNKRLCENGAIIIEATISLTTYMFAIFLILMVSRFCFAQAKIGTVIDGIAKDLSEFSYVYSLSGLAEKHAKISSEATQAANSVDSVMSNLSDISSTLDSLTELGSSLINDEEMRSSMMSLLKNEGINKGEAILTSLAAKEFAKSRLSGTSNIENVLKKLGIKKTKSTYLDSINFGDSVFCANGSSEIKVVARYSLTFFKLLSFEYSFDICQCASTKAWGAAQKSDEEIEEKMTENEEEDNQDKEDEEKNKEEEKPKSAEELAKEYTHNPSSDKVIVGPEYSVSKDGEMFGATYFVANDEYDGNYDKWTIYKKFLEQNKNKDIYLNFDPTEMMFDPTMKKAVVWLQDNGYKFKENSAVGLWEAVK